MPVQQDFLSYHRSIGEELKTSENRVRNLIGNSHWLTDGEHKESILRKVLAGFSPEIYRIGTGFVCYPSADPESSKNSGQIDILVTSKNDPTLYKSGELHFVTPECAHAIIEVKTKASNGQDLDKIVKKLSDEVKEIRRKTQGKTKCWAGLFIYNEEDLTDRNVLESLQRIIAGDEMAAINCIAIGEETFIRFWEHAQSESEPSIAPVWHSYKLSQLAKAYFVSNLVSHLSPALSGLSAEAWFPIHGTKEVHRTLYAELRSIGVFEF